MAQKKVGRGIGRKFSVASPGSKQARANARFGVNQPKMPRRPAKPKTGFDIFSETIMARKKK